MSTTTTKTTQPARDPNRDMLPTLEPGDHLDQQTFHTRYEALPEDIKAELVGGVVFMPAAMKRPHGRSHGLLMHWLSAYEVATFGVESYDNTTTIMGDDSEPQPDACLIVLPEKGGQTRVTADDYLEGAPEFVAEIASATESYDLHNKQRDYEKAGVKEYLVVALRQRKVFWFINRDGKFERTPTPADGIYRSDEFPGLWLDPEALLSLDAPRLLEVLQQGLASDEHAAFVRRLAD